LYLVVADVVMMTIIYRPNKVILVVLDYGMEPWYNHKPRQGDLHTQFHHNALD